MTPLTEDDQTDKARRNGSSPAGSGPVGVSGDSTVIARGLSKREEFAKAAMQGICASELFMDSTTAALAKEAVLLADALLQELAK